MNPHTPHPDESNDPSGSPAGQPGGQTGGQSFGEPAGQQAGQPSDSAGGPSPEDLPLHREAPPLYPPGEPDGPGAPLPPPYYGPAPPPAGAQPQNFFDWLRSHGIYRGRGRWIGGVASGIAQRLGVDPLIVRGILIVLTIFAGVGVLLYGVAWALLPEPDGRIHVQEAAAGRWTSGMTGALITTIIGLPTLGSGVWGWDRYGFGGFVWTVFWVGGAIYLAYYLTQRKKTRNGTAAMSTPASHGQTSSTLPAYGASGYDYSTVPGPAWGAPLPSGPMLPPGGAYRPVPGGGPVPPGPVPPAKARNLGPGAPAVAVTAGLALLVGGGIKALDAAGVANLGDSSNAVVWAGGAAVLGLGILVAGLRGRTSGILGFFAAVALIIGGIFNVVPNGDRFRFQNADWSPASIEQARDGFELTGGTGTADLRTLALNPPLGTDVVVPIDATASNLTVLIPDTVPVQIQADMTMGNLNEGGRSQGGMTTRQSDYNTGMPGARLILKISGTASNVTIQEGN
ncbi:PspC domain-containing protein [Arthrobacter sp. CG_A4]|uniref:PspC domain-containing protein n=1 Tax=Arthrobacter sp. CG_A4 TaxID=3071706 RepID=UPI002DF7E42C|nr:phage shock protein PspC (stress-responsive transcriptional regulator) [Arthrobacter sp. CG_A4]